MDHPKYTLKLEIQIHGPYRIYEYTLFDQKIGNKLHSSYPTLDAALDALVRLCKEPITIAWSNQAIDNTFDMREG